ncbi:HD domain-containing protein [Candidatus Peregrinibacteria bacterium]|jgi:HD-GYP domain-containing protein (c-di-GMP phosphodiesterase class II)|nr:HD domain-containing protein [Candidatus Peregrinibacteria bacterium]
MLDGAPLSLEIDTAEERLLPVADVFSCADITPEVNERILMVLKRLVVDDFENNPEYPVLVDAVIQEVRRPLAEYIRGIVLPGEENLLDPTLATIASKLEVGSEAKPHAPSVKAAILDAVKRLDKELYEHLESTAMLAYQIARSVSEKGEVEDPALAMISRDGGFLHDIGKIDASITALINQKRDLTLPEWKTVYQHPVIGGIVLKLLSLPDRVAKVADKHHVTNHKSPRRGIHPLNELPWEVKIATVADHISAMLDDRPNHPVKPMGRLIKTLKKDSSKERGILDPIAVEAFLGICTELGYDEASEEVIPARLLLLNYARMRQEM